VADDGVDVGQRLARQLKDLYATAELNLITAVTKALRAGMDATGLHFRPAAFRALRATAQRVAGLLAHDSTAMATQIVQEAVRLGSVQAVTELAAEVQALPVVAPAIEAIQQDLVTKLAQTEFRTIRWAPDVYQQAIMPQVQHILAGEMSPLEAQQAAWEKLASNGVTGFVDNTGRGWELQSYVEMATRTATQRAWNEQHTAEYRAASVDLVMVSTAPDCCELCAPFQSAVLSIGPVPADMPDVVMSVDDARSDGLQHYMCRCAYTPFIEGVTEPFATPVDPVMREDREQLRYLERGVRQWKRREVAALTPQAKKAAGVKVRLWQARIRQHVATTNTVRKPYREQIK